jgi:hypothetical protein
MACLKRSGTIPDSKDEFTIETIKGSKTVKELFKRSVLIGSREHDFVFIVKMVFCRLSGVTSSNSERE